MKFKLIFLNKVRLPNKRNSIQFSEHYIPQSPPQSTYEIYKLMHIFTDFRIRAYFLHIFPFSLKKIKNETLNFYLKAESKI